MLLGLVQGPAEFLPVSSSGHLALLPRLLGWPTTELSPASRKTLEVALHAGSAPAVALAMRGRLEPDARLLLTLAPPAVAALLFEERIEARFGTARSVALAQIGAGVAMILADRRPTGRHRPTAGDHLAVGLAQAAALVPGVSRGGGALIATRLRGLDRPAAARLSLAAALPITAGAAVLKGVRAAQGGVPRELAAPLAAGAAAALASGVAARPLARWLERAPSYAPVGVYRVALGLTALAVGENPRR